MSISAAPRFVPFTTFAQFHRTLRAQLTQDIDVLFAHTNLPSPLNEACRYVMTGQGKLVRPLLVASSFVSVNAANQLVDHARLTATQTDNLDTLLNDDSRYDMCRRAALAVELLHTYSLVHDDLPCMDDDELRRGQPTCHIVFDEATALLVGDVLQTLAFEILTVEIPTFTAFDSSLASQLLAIFAPRARRMVAGQMLDLNAEANANISQNDLESIHRDKTGALIEAAVLMGGICAQATALQRTALQDCAQHIGLAFQVQDDVLDVTMTTDTLGKPAGSDEKLDKSTYVKLMGVDTASEYAKTLFETAKGTITHSFGIDNALIELADWLWARQK